MAELTLIMGESGTGKSASIRTLNPKQTFLINVIGKSLPFKGSKKIYSKESQNCVDSFNTEKIIQTINYVNNKMPHITNIVIDDYQYIMAAEYMKRANEKGFKIFIDIAADIWKILLDSAKICRKDLYIFILSHNEVDENGISRCKTIGRMLNEKLTIDGFFTCILHTVIENGKYKFKTQNDGRSIAKAPMGMFDSILIDNDLNFVKQKMLAYYETEENVK